MTDRPPDRTTVTRSLRPLVAIGGVIGAILLVAIVVVALSQRDDPETAGESPSPSASALVTGSSAPSDSPTTSASASATAEPSVPAGPPTIAWDEPAPFDGAPAELMADGDTWVAVGWATERGPGAWTSTDAIAWERADVVDPQPDDMFRGSGLGPAVRLGDTLLSYGTFVGCCDGAGVLAWRSADGTSWDVLESDGPLFETGYIVNELVVGDTALVAVEGRYAAFTGRIWRWTEGTSWVETTPATAGTDQSSGMITSDVTWAGGRFVVVGSRGDPATGLSIAGVSWTSSDGENWEESAPGPELEDVDLLQVAPMPGGGFVVLGINDAANFGRDGGSVAFTSPDGLAWTPVEMPASGQGTHPTEIVVVDGGLVAIGSGAGATTIVWSSADGSIWTDAGRLEYTPIAAAAIGDQIVVIGAEFQPGEVYVLNRGTLGR